MIKFGSDEKIADYPDLIFQNYMAISKIITSRQYGCKSMEKFMKKQNFFNRGD